MVNRSLKRAWRFVLVLFLVALLIRLMAISRSFVEQYYTNGFYIFISHTLRVLFGWLPFSIGDIIYTVAAVWLLLLVIRFIRLLFKRKMTKQKWLSALRKLLQFALLVYIIFNLFWGLNYNRLGIAYQLRLKPQKETKEDLNALTGMLLERVNKARQNLPEKVTYLSYQQSFAESVSAYQKAQKKYAFLQYNFTSVKPSMYSLPGNYLGYSGYYNPFSAEAQVNVKMLPFTTPYVTCHEMAHQLGYATEDEANFVGYLAAKSSPDPQFQYSVYFDLFNYANRELYLYDSVAARANYEALDTLVKKDIIMYRRFWQRYQNAIEPVITMLYGHYLKANNQPAGLRTYDLVTALLIDYRKKYGEL